MAFGSEEQAPGSERADCERTRRWPASRMCRARGRSGFFLSRVLLRCSNRGREHQGGTKV